MSRKPPGSAQAILRTAACRGGSAAAAGIVADGEHGDVRGHGRVRVGIAVGLGLRHGSGVLPPRVDRGAWKKTSVADHSVVTTLTQVRRSLLKPVVRPPVLTIMAPAATDFFAPPRAVRGRRHACTSHLAGGLFILGFDGTALDAALAETVDRALAPGRLHPVSAQHRHARRGRAAVPGSARALSRRRPAAHQRGSGGRSGGPAARALHGAAAARLLGRHYQQTGSLELLRARRRGHRQPNSPRWASTSTTRRCWTWTATRPIRSSATAPMAARRRLVSAVARR
jgi:hypothetical protein